MNIRTMMMVDELGSPQWSFLHYDSTEEINRSKIPESSERRSVRSSI
jgi:hypothetical protein